MLREEIYEYALKDIADYGYSGPQWLAQFVLYRDSTSFLTPDEKLRLNMSALKFIVNDDSDGRSVAVANFALELGANV